MFSVVAINQGLCPVSHIQLMSRCAEGSITRQIAKTTNGNIPYHERHAQFKNGHWLREEDYHFFQELESSLGWKFELLFRAANWSVGGEKN